MAAPNYAAIRTAIKTAIDAANLSVAGPNGNVTPKVTIEESLFVGASDNVALVGIFMTGRRPSVGQPLAGGQRGRYLVDLTLWALYFDMQSLENAIARRDELLAAVEQVLMRDRTYSGATASAWLEGGEVFAAKDAQPFPFVAGGEIKLVCEINFTST